LLLPQPDQTHYRAKFQGFGLLLAGNVDGLYSGFHVRATFFSVGAKLVFALGVWATTKIAPTRVVPWIQKE
jgi:hypothetical protein